MAGIQAPYGDIYFVQTPSMDRAAQQLHAEEQQRQAMGYKDWISTQQELQKQFSNLRSPDVPDAVKKYQEWKQLQGALYFDKKLQHDPLQYNQVKQQATQKFGELQGLINGSAELKENFKSISQARLSNPDHFDDNAGGLMVQDMNTPTAKLIQGGWSPDKYAYKGSNTDFGQLDKLAKGEVQTTAGDTKLTKDGLQFIDSTFKHGNSPAQYATTLMGELQKRQAGKDAVIAYQSMPQEQKDAVEQAYNNIPDDVWQKWGVPKQKLSQADVPSEAGKYAVMQAQLYALNNEPQQGEPKYRDNVGAVKGLELKNQEIMEGIRQGNRKNLVDYREWYKKQNAQEQNDFIDTYYNSIFDDAKKNQKDFIQKGEKIKTYEIKASPEIKKLFDYNGVYPDRVRFLENGDVLPIFFKYEGNKDAGYKKDTKGVPKGHAVVDEELSVPMPKDEFKIRLGKQLLGQKEANNEVLDNDDEGESESGGYQIKVPASSSNKWDKYKVNK